APVATPSRSRSLLAAPADPAWLAGARAALREMADTAAAAADATSSRGSFLRTAPAPSETLRVHAIVAESHLTLVFETPGSVQARQVAWRRADATQEIGALLGAMDRHEAALPQLQALYRRIGAPIAEAARSVGARRIVLFGDDVLRYLPMAALHDGQAYLGEQFTLLQQARPLDSAARGMAVRVPVLQAVGVSRPLPGQPALPGVAREVCAIVAGPVRGLTDVDSACGSGAGVVPGEGWLNEEFTARRFSDATARAGAGGGGAMLHVGTHFDLRPGQMARSSLLLGDGSRLTLDTIARLDFRGHDLVTLSACETGLGGAAGSDGREVEGLNLLLVRRGARAVLASLWRVDDRSTSALMAVFYRELASTDVAEALRRAQDAVRANPDWRAPFHWAGFYVTVRP
ncbi:MAG: CHAT domain-containing protein, partial [Bacteroidia bacterium]